MIYKDSLGMEIKIGDVVAYPGGSSGSTRINISEVVSFVDIKRKEGRWTTVNGEQVHERYEVDDFKLRVKKVKETSWRETATDTTTERIQTITRVNRVINLSNSFYNTRSIEIINDVGIWAETTEHGFAASEVLTIINGEEL